MQASIPLPFALRAADYRLPGELALTVVDETGSTNTDLLELARAGSLAVGDTGRATIRVALAQSAGRGRLGRAWQAAPGASLLMSVGCTRRVAAQDLSGITVALGTRAAVVLQTHGVSAQVKWPNDVLVDGAKLAGILVETVAAPAGLAIVAGIGVNGVMEQSLRGNVDQPVAALGDLLPLTQPQAAQIGHDLAVAFAQLLLAADLRAAIAATLRERHALLDACRDRPVKLVADGQTTGAGIARGVDEAGCLLLETSQGLRRLTSGEVSLRWQ
jgi:BirA family transcriptional regulator, biotin operon repressor / biotin---[acetyl-CoA-carboxylase] ligase